MIFVWIKEKEVKSNYIFNDNSPTISVIIPIRNEAKNIINLLESIENQTYPKNKFEVIIADDCSTDNSLELIEHFKKKSTITLIINKLSNISVNSSPKKRAISSSILLAQNQIIITTDGDCIVKKNWLASFSHQYEKSSTILAFGSVTFIKETNSFFENIQILEFASLAGTAASSLLLKHPNMCSGANLSFLKSAFEAVNGYKGNEEIASGDDEFLMHKIAKMYPKQIAYIKNQDSIVETTAHQNLKSFVQQRKRWASKWSSYENWQISALAVFIFMVNLSVIILPFIVDLESALILILIKFISEFIFILLIIKYLNKTYTFLFLPILQIIYPFYVCFFGLIVQKKGYNWKERELK